MSNISKARQARIIKGDIFGKHDVTDEVADIRLLLAPLALEDVKTVRCLGLNYALHAKEVRLMQEGMHLVGEALLTVHIVGPPRAPVPSSIRKACPFWEFLAGKIVSLLKTYL